MQNCLQKKNSVFTAGMCVLSAMLGLWISMLIFTLVFKHCLIRVEGADAQNVALTLFEVLDESEGEDVLNVDENSKKMNNLSCYVAKNDENTVLNINDGISCKSVRVLFDDGTVREMGLEEYTAGCVFGEMPIGFESAALMAQTVAVRTFTVRQCCGKSKHKNADICTDSACCQSYVSLEDKKISPDNRKKLLDAVAATKGIIMVYDGEPIEAVYHASSGGRTLNSEDVWGGRVEYLRSVPSPEGEAELTSVLYGHRVGMSQQGANLLAKQGFSYPQILRYYYNGISFDFLS